MKKVGLWLLGILAYLIFTVLLTPASWWLKFATLPAGLQLGPVSGTLWSGQVQGVRWQKLVVPSLTWQLDLSAVWRGQLGLALKGGDVKIDSLPFFQLNAELTPSRFTILPSNLRVPMATMMQNVQLPMPADASGSVVLNIKDFELGKPYCSRLVGNASWQDAKFKAPTGWLDLKAIHATLGCENGAIVLNTSADNPLALLVKAEVAADSYRVAGTLKPDASMPPEMHQAMQFVGPTDNEGRFILDLKGRIQN